MRDMRSYEEYCEAVQHPGPFEAEAPYVPFYWDMYLNGSADRDDGIKLGFDVSAEDRVMFPELRGRHAVNLIQRDDGFVIEV